MKEGLYVMVLGLALAASSDTKKQVDQNSQQTIEERVALEKDERETEIYLKKIKVEQPFIAYKTLALEHLPTLKKLGRDDKINSLRKYLLDNYTPAMADANRWMVQSLRERDYFSFYGMTQTVREIHQTIRAENIPIKEERLNATERAISALYSMLKK